MYLTLIVKEKSTFQNTSHINQLGMKFDLPKVGHGLPEIIIQVNSVGLSFADATYQVQGSLAFWF